MSLVRPELAAHGFSAGNLVVEVIVQAYVICTYGTRPLVRVNHWVTFEALEIVQVVVQ